MPPFGVQRIGGWGRDQVNIEVDHAEIDHTGLPGVGGSGGVSASFDEATHNALDHSSVPGISLPGLHPDLTGHDLLGLATQDALNGHSHTHPDLAAHDSLGLATQTELNSHSHTNPVITHEAASDPHTGYQLKNQKAQANGYASLDGSGLIPDAQIPASIARDSELTAHAGATDPHVGYRKENEDHTHGSTGAQGGLVAHSALTGLANDEHTQYQKESEKAIANGYASLDAGTKVPLVQLGGAGADATKFLRGDQTWQTIAGAPGNDPRITTRTLVSDQADITGVALVELIDLTVAGLIAGTYVFKYYIIYQTTALTTGVEFVVDHTGTDSAFVSNARFGSTGGAAATGIADQVGIGTAAGLMEVKTQRVSGARPGVTIGVDTINANCLMIIEGVIVTTSTGDLKLMMAAELAALVCRAKAGSSLILTKTS